MQLIICFVLNCCLIPAFPFFQRRWNSTRGGQAAYGAAASRCVGADEPTYTKLCGCKSEDIVKRGAGRRTRRWSIEAIQIIINTNQFAVLKIDIGIYYSSILRPFVETQFQYNLPVSYTPRWVPRKQSQIRHFAIQAPQISFL